METPEIKRPDDEEREHVLITEWDGLSPLPAGATDAHLLEDADAMPFSWDVEHENPPHEGYDGPLPHPDLQKPT